MEPSLSILKGEYYLENRGNILILIVDYANKQFAVKIIRHDNNEIVAKMKVYLEKFAQDMIKSKSNRNFYKPIYA